MTIKSFCIVCQHRAKLTLLSHDGYECDVCGTRVDETLTKPMRLKRMREILGYSRPEVSIRMGLTNYGALRYYEMKDTNTKGAIDYESFLKNALKLEFKNQHN